MDVFIRDRSGSEAFHAYSQNGKEDELVDTSAEADYEDSDLKEASTCKLICSRAY